jgi:hypothetical protein
VLFASHERERAVAVATRAVMVAGGAANDILLSGDAG